MSWVNSGRNGFPNTETFSTVLNEGRGRGREGKGAIRNKYMQETCII
jgi:hypothetical protein